MYTAAKSIRPTAVKEATPPIPPPKAGGNNAAKYPPLGRGNTRGWVKTRAFKLKNIYFNKNRLIFYGKRG